MSKSIQDTIEDKLIKIQYPNSEANNLRYSIESNLTIRMNVFHVFQTLTNSKHNLLHIEYLADTKDDLNSLSNLLKELQEEYRFSFSELTQERGILRIDNIKYK